MKTSKWRLIGMGLSCSALTYLGTSLFYEINFIPLLFLMGGAIFCTFIYLNEKGVD